MLLHVLKYLFRELTGGAKSLIAIIIILVVIGAPLLYMCKKKLPHLLSQRQNPSPVVQGKFIIKLQFELVNINKLSLIKFSFVYLIGSRLVLVDIKIKLLKLLINYQ